MPIWENYTVDVTVGWEIRCAGKLIAAGGAPGEGRGTSNRQVTGLTMEEATAEAIDQAKTRALASVRGTETARRRELGYEDGH